MANDNKQNKQPNSTSKGWSPPSGKDHPPAAGAHAGDKPTRHNGSSGPQWVHPSLKKT